MITLSPRTDHRTGQGGKLRILIGDDDRALADTLTAVVTACGHEVVSTVTSGGLDVLYAYDRCAPDVILIDVMMPCFNGFTICHAILSRNPSATVILMSGRLSSDHPFVLNSGARLFLRKPLRMARVIQALDEIAEPSHAGSRV